MAKRSIDIVVEDGNVVLRCQSIPDVMSGQIRILLGSVFGYEVNETNGRYHKAIDSDTPREVKDILLFFSENKIPVDLASEIQSLLSNYASSERLLINAKKEGARIKKSPPRQMDVPNLTRSLKPYQIPAVAHMMAVRNAANFSVPGSGKTTVALANYYAARKSGEVKAMLVVCPRSAFLPWTDEIRDTSSVVLKVIRITGSRAERVRCYGEAHEADIILITYQSLTNDSDDVAILLRGRPTFLLLDESHYIKRMDGGKWANALLAVAPLAKRRIILTGTPVPNGLEDLWSQMAFLWPDPTPLGDREQYRSLLAKRGASAIEQVQSILRPLYWRIKKSDLRLPKPRFHRVQVPMEQYQQGIYNALSAKVLSEVVSEPENRKRLREWRRARMTRLLQASTNPSLLTKYSQEFKIPPLDASGLSIEQIIEKYSDFETPSKIDYTVKLVQRLAKKGLKVLVWTSFVHNIQMLQKMLSDLNPSVIYGDVPKDESENEAYNRELMISQFKEKSECCVLIGNPSACAESISLHRICKHAIFVDRTFNGAHYFQALDRIHRIGLERKETVHYYILQSLNTIDDVIDKRLEEKKKRMLHILEDDFDELDLESPQDEFSEESEEDKDFSAMIKQLKLQYANRHAA